MSYLRFEKALMTNLQDSGVSQQPGWYSFQCSTIYYVLRCFYSKPRELHSGRETG